MILGYEEPVQMPTMDIYSTDLMKMYIEGVREQYKEGLDEYKDFMKQYQDFYSSLPGANEYWYNNTIKPANDLISQAAAQGIDLFKSPEGRAAIRNMIGSVPIGKLKEVQAASENYDKYLDSVAKLDEQGKYDKGFQDFILNQMFPGGYQLQDANGNINPWNLRNATPYQDMTEATAPWFEGMKDTFLGTTPDGRYNLMGIDETSMQPILDQNMSDYLSSPLGQYHFKQFANSLPPGTTPEQAFGAFKNEIMAKNRRIQHVEREADPYAQDDHSTANNIRANAAKAATDFYYDTQKILLEQPWLDKNSPLWIGNPKSPYYTGGGKGQHFRNNRTQSTNKGGNYSKMLQNDYVSEEKRANASGAVWVKDGKLPGGGSYGIPDPNGSIKGERGNYREVDEYGMQELALKKANNFNIISIPEDNELETAILTTFGDGKETLYKTFFDHLVPAGKAWNNAYGVGKEKLKSKETIEKQAAAIIQAKNYDPNDVNKINPVTGREYTNYTPQVEYIGKSVVVLDKDHKHKSAYTRYLVDGQPVLFKYAQYKRGDDGTWVVDQRLGDWVYSLDKKVSDLMQGNGVTITNTTSE